MSVIPPLFYFISVLLGLKQDIHFENIACKVDMTKNQGVLVLEYPKIQENSKLSPEDSLKLYQKAPFQSTEGDFQVESYKIIPKKSLVQIKFKATDPKDIFQMLQIIEVRKELMKKIPAKYEEHIHLGNLIMVIPKSNIKGKIKTNGKIYYDEDEKVNLIIWPEHIQEIEISVSTPFYHGEQYLELYD